MGGWGFMESLFDDVKLRGFPSKVPSSSVSPCKKSNLAFSMARFKASARKFCSILKYSLVHSSIWLV